MENIFSVFYMAHVTAAPSIKRLKARPGWLVVVFLHKHNIAHRSPPREAQLG